MIEMVIGCKMMARYVQTNKMIFFFFQFWNSVVIRVRIRVIIFPLVQQKPKEDLYIET
jgi:hypothetical protein